MIVEGFLCMSLRPIACNHNWGERERAPTLLMSMEIVYVRAYVRTCVHVRPPDCACANVRILLTLLFLEISWFCSCSFLVQEMSQTQQESDRQKRLERRRQQDRDKHTRETPDERNRRRGLFNARSYFFMRAWSSNRHKI